LNGKIESVPPRNDQKMAPDDRWVLLCQSWVVEEEMP